MAFTVIIALASAFVLSLTFVPALIAIAVTGRVQEKENLLIRGLKVPYRPALAAAIRAPRPVIAAAILVFAGAALLFTALGQEFTPTLDEKTS
jgi:cobalt-zinc-cadmium resistance protein CzcA